MVMICPSVFVMKFLIHKILNAWKQEVKVPRRNLNLSLRQDTMRCAVDCARSYLARNI